MKKQLLAVALVLGISCSFAGCALKETKKETNDPAVQSEEKTTSESKIKGSWTVTATPEVVSISKPEDLENFKDTARLADTAILGSINALFPIDSTFEVFDDGICICNSIKLKYNFLDEKTLELFADGTSGLTFKITKDGDCLKLNSNDKYEVVLSKKAE